MSSLATKLKNGAKKAAMNSAIGAGLSLLFLGGLEGTKVLGTSVPKFVVQAGALGLSSYATDMLVPMIVPWIGSDMGQPAVLSKFEGVVLQPLMAGVAVLAVETILSPSTIAESGGALKSLLAGSASSVGAFYILDNMGWVSN